MMKQRPKPKPLLVENYLLFAKASVGSAAFRKLYYLIDGKKIEILRDGDLSCAFFVSAILTIAGLMGVVHTTVKHTVRDLKRRGWKPIKSPVVGSVIVWAPKKFKSGETHRHIGFYLGGGKAVSNSSKKKSPQIHSWNFRPVEEILWNNNLLKK
jgi:hypothetical protein